MSEQEKMLAGILLAAITFTFALPGGFDFRLFVLTPTLLSVIIAFGSLTILNFKFIITYQIKRRKV